MREKPLGVIHEAHVYSSARISSRTPFGTGRAVSEFYHSEQSDWLLPHPDRFEDLRVLCLHLDLLYQYGPEALYAHVPAELGEELKNAGLESVLPGMRQHAASQASFDRRFFSWFDGLKAWRYVNRQGSKLPILEALPLLACRCGIVDSAGSDLAWLKLLIEQSIP